ncbi:MAG: hypothetical protein Aurels2KO_27550 [Aureliella sp.]
MIYTESGVLDELFFHHAPMRRAGEASSQVALGHRIESFKGELLLPSPMILYDSPALMHEAVWARACAAFRGASVPVFASADRFKMVPAEAVPVRFAQTFAGEPLRFDDIATADAIQVNCWQRKTNNARWPSEAGGDQIAAYLDAIRIAAGSDVPVGVGFQVGVCDLDIETAIAAGAEFIGVFAGDPFVSIQHVVALRRIRAACIAAGKSSMIVIASLPAVKPDEMLKLLAVGASVVSIDTSLANLASEISAQTKQVDKQTSGGLGSALLNALEPNDDPVGKSLERLPEQLESCREKMIDRMAEIGATSLSTLTEANLRTSSTTLSKLLGIEML